MCACRRYKDTAPPPAQQQPQLACRSFLGRWAAAPYVLAEVRGEGVATVFTSVRGAKLDVHMQDGCTIGGVSRDTGLGSSVPFLGVFFHEGKVGYLLTT